MINKTTKTEQIYKINKILAENKVLNKANDQLSKKEFCLDQELTKIHNSRLWKIYLLYRKILKKLKIKEDHPNDKSKINYLPGNFKENFVLGICHPEWQGVKNATLNQSSRVITLNLFDNETINEIISFIKKNKFQKVAINAIPNGTDLFIKKLKQKIPRVKIYLIWHGSFTQQTIEDHITRIDSIYPYFNKIYKFGFVKNNTAEIFRKLGVKADFLPNRISTQKNTLNIKNINHKKIKIGILSKFSWHKNNLNQIIAASLVPNSEIHTLFFPKIKYLSKLLNKKIRQHPSLEHDKYQKLLSQVHINLYISLTECYPMSFIESLLEGTPCLVGKTSEFILKNNQKLKKFLVVQNPENILEIKEKIENIVDNYSEVQKLCHSFINKINDYNSQLILKFFKN